MCPRRGVPSWGPPPPESESDDNADGDFLYEFEFEIDVEVGHIGAYEITSDNEDTALSKTSTIGMEFE